MVASPAHGYRRPRESSLRSQAGAAPVWSRPGATRGTILKKGITLIAVLVAVLAVTSGGFAAVKHYRITSSTQIKNGAVSVSDLSAAARKALRGQKGDTGAAGLQGSKGDTGATGATGAQGPR